MYKKTITNITKEKEKQFKPRRIVLGGIVYNVDSMSTLTTLRDQFKKKKETEIQEQEEQNNQQKFVRRIITSKKSDNNTTFKKINSQNKTIIKSKIDIDKQLSTDQTKNKKITNFNNNSKIESTNQIQVTSRTKKKINIISENTENENDKVKKNIDIVSVDSENTENENDKVKKDIDIVSDDSENTEIENEVKIKPFTIISKSKKKNIRQTDEDKIHKPIIKPKKVILIDTNDTESIIEDDTKKINTNISQYYTKNLMVKQLQWYNLIILIGSQDVGLLKLFDNNKNQILPLIRIPNQIFIYENNEQLTEYHIYFYSTELMTEINIYGVGLSINDITVKTLTKEQVKENIDLWKFRKSYDLEFINYYLSNLELNPNNKFMDRYQADYKLFKNCNYFDNFIQTIDVAKDNYNNIENDSKINILYLIYTSIEYENYGYTVRTHNILKNINNDNFNVYGVTRYGYPFDRENDYYNDTPDDEFTLDNVKYLKLLNGTDNFNNNNIIEYLEKYIIAVIKLAIKYNAKIIHSTNNYWNGLAALYASKYLNIKSIYELRGFWDEGSIIYKPELKDSDMIKMTNNLEKKILNEIDHILCTNQLVKNRLITEGYDETKITIINNGVDTSLFKKDEKLSIELKNDLNINKNTIIIGYIGTLGNLDGIDNIIRCLKILKNQSIKFVIIGDGPIKNDIIDLSNKLKIRDKIIYLGKISHSDAIKYYNIFDIFILPKKIHDSFSSVGNNKLYESMSMEIPVIISELDIYKEDIINNETGLFFRPDNINDLQQKIKILIEDENLRKYLGYNARMWVINNREWNNICMKLINVYNSKN